MPLLGRDLLSKLKAQISFSSKGTIVNWQAPTSMILALKLEEEYRLHEPLALLGKTLGGAWLKLFPGSWAKKGAMGEVKRMPPIIINLKTDAIPLGYDNTP